MKNTGEITLHSEQPNRENVDFTATAILPLEDVDPEWGAFAGGEISDGAGVIHLVEGRFNRRNNNVTAILHSYNGTVETIGRPDVKIDDFGVNPFTGWVRVRGHDNDPNSQFRAMGSRRGGFTLNGWTPRAAGEGGGVLSLPAYDSRRQSFVDVSTDSPFHRAIEGLVDLELISGYDLGNGKREFRQGVGLTRAQGAKLIYGALRWLVGALARRK